MLTYDARQNGVTPQTQRRRRHPQQQVVRFMLDGAIDFRNNDWQLCSPLPCSRCFVFLDTKTTNTRGTPWRFGNHYGKSCLCLLVFATPQFLSRSPSPSLNPSPSGVLAVRVFRPGPDSDRGGARPNSPDSDTAAYYCLASITE